MLVSRPAVADGELTPAMARGEKRVADCAGGDDTPLNSRPGGGGERRRPGDSSPSEL